MSDLDNIPAGTTFSIPEILADETHMLYDTITEALEKLKNGELVLS